MSEHAPPRRIWLCADDFGISAAVNTAIRDLVVRRRLNATSALVVAPSFQRSEAVALDVLNAAAPRVAIGLHLTLTAPFQPLSKSFKPLREGAFLPLAAMAGRALMHQLEPDALAAEVTRQVECFIESFGRTPDFIDGHHHVHIFPQISDVLFAVVARAAPNAWLRQCGRVVCIGFYGSDEPALSLGEEFLHNRLTLLASLPALSWNNPTRGASPKYAKDLQAAVVDDFRTRRLSSDGILYPVVPFHMAEEAPNLIAAAPERVLKVMIDHT